MECNNFAVGFNLILRAQINCCKKNKYIYVHIYVCVRAMLYLRVCVYFCMCNALSYGCEKKMACKLKKKRSQN